MADDENLGSCCSCGTTINVRNIIMLPFRGPVSGQGWGCIICDLPMDGAVAVVCDECSAQDRPLKFVCQGDPRDNRRVPIAKFREGPSHDHDLSRHDLDDGG